MRLRTILYEGTTYPALEQDGSLLVTEALAGQDIGAVIAAGPAQWANWLEPGDVLLTGTPWGAGECLYPPRQLAPGDVVEVEVRGIGVLRNSIVATGDTREASRGRLQAPVH